MFLFVFKNLYIFYFFLFCFFCRYFSIYFVFGFSLLIVVFISFYYNILHVIFFFYTFHVSAVKALYFYHLLPLLLEVLPKLWGNLNNAREPNIYPATLCKFLYKHQATELLRKWRWKLGFRVNFMILRTLQLHIAL